MVPSFQALNYRQLQPQIDSLRHNAKMYYVTNLVWPDWKSHTDPTNCITFIPALLRSWWLRVRGASVYKNMCYQYGESYHKNGFMTLPTLLRKLPLLERRSLYWDSFIGRGSDVETDCITFTVLDQRSFLHRHTNRMSHLAAYLDVALDDSIWRGLRWLMYLSTKMVKVCCKV